MPIRQRLVTYGIPTAAAATVALAAMLTPWHGSRTGAPIEPATPTPIAANRHAVDVVFAVDTTSSMGSLIDGAKRTVWSIATKIRQTDPQAELRIGLIAYRDIGDDYVTKDFALTTDLDAVFAELSAYRAEGGGDIPEDVDAALYDAVHHVEWRDGAKKLVFLVGDAPPATRGDVPAFDVTARLAGEQQIIINTIRCGFDPDTAAAWQQIASLSHGEYSSVREDGGVQQVATPFDAQIATTSAVIDGSAVIYGDTAERGAYHGKMAAAAMAPAPTVADRAAFYASGGPGAARDGHDVVGAIAGGTLSVDTLEAAKLPDELKNLSKDALRVELSQRAAVRATAEAQLRDLTSKRADYLRAHQPADGFDAKVNAAVVDELR